MFVLAYKTEFQAFKDGLQGISQAPGLFDREDSRIGPHPEGSNRVARFPAYLYSPVVFQSYCYCVKKFP